MLAAGTSRLQLFTMHQLTTGLARPQAARATHRFQRNPRRPRARSLAPVRASTSVQGPATLLERIGGTGALAACVDAFYERLLSDGSLAPFFEGVDLVKLKDHQNAFMSMALTSIPEGVDPAARMEKGHARLFTLGLNASHFDRVAEHLVATLQAAGVGAGEVDEVVARVAPLRAAFERAAAGHNDA